MNRKEFLKQIRDKYSEHPNALSWGEVVRYNKITLSLRLPYLYTNWEGFTTRITTDIFDSGYNILYALDDMIYPKSVFDTVFSKEAQEGLRLMIRSNERVELTSILNNYLESYGKWYNYTFTVGFDLEKDLRFEFNFNFTSKGTLTERSGRSYFRIVASSNSSKYNTDLRPLDINVFDKEIRLIGDTILNIKSNPIIIELENKLKAFKDSDAFKEMRNQRQFISIPKADLPVFSKKITFEPDPSYKKMSNDFTDLLLENSKQELMCNDIVGAIRKIQNIQTTFFWKNPFFIVNFLQELNITDEETYAECINICLEKWYISITVYNSPWVLIPKILWNNVNKRHFQLYSNVHEGVVFEEGITSVNNNTISGAASCILILPASFTGSFDILKVFSSGGELRFIKNKFVITFTGEESNFKIPRYQYEFLKEHGLLYRAE